MADSTGMQDLRDENIDKIVKGFALQSYKFKQVCMTRSGSAWTETYYQETSTELTAAGTRSVKGIPRLAKFPYGEVTWTKVQARIEKYGMEGVISYEDINFNAIDVVARTLLRIGRAVAKSVDDEIWRVLSEGQSPSTINSVSITAGNEWDSATVANRDPVQDILNAKKEIAVDNYDPEGAFLILSPKDYANLLGNDKISNNPSFRAADVISNGAVGKVLGLTIIVSNSVTASYAMVAVPSECATWVESVPLQTHVIDDPGIKKTIRAFEMGTTQLTNPQAVCLIKNTQKA